MTPPLRTDSHSSAPGTSGTPTRAPLGPCGPYGTSLPRPPRASREPFAEGDALDIACACDSIVLHRPPSPRRRRAPRQSGTHGRGRQRHRPPGQPHRPGRRARHPRHGPRLASAGARRRPRGRSPLRLHPSRMCYSSCGHGDCRYAAVTGGIRYRHHRPRRREYVAADACRGVVPALDRAPPPRS